MLIFKNQFYKIYVVSVWSKSKLLTEFTYKAVRSGGAGGQHVNKVSSKIELSWDSSATLVFTAEQIDILKQKLAGYINKEGFLKLQCDTHRSQIKNKEEIIVRALNLFAGALKIAKPRLNTKPTKKSIMQKKQLKIKLSELKNQRRNKNVKF